LQRRAAGLLLWARLAGDIDRRRRSGTAHSSTAVSIKGRAVSRFQPP